MSDDNEDLLSLLNAHGQQFLSSFASADPTSKKRKGVPTTALAPSKRARSESSNSDEEEWTGFGASTTSGTHSGESSGEDGEEEGDEDLVADDGYTAGRSVSQPEVVVFSDSRDTTAPRPIRSRMKSFMSSKVSKLRTDFDPEPSAASRSKEEQDDDRTNAQNDAALHKLVHTQLLSGSLDPSLNLTSAYRKKALQGRVLELAGAVRLGKGEKAVRKKEHARASKAVRDGIEDKRVERKDKTLIEAKDMGNWHPTIKKLLADEDESSHARKREKGLGMGVGKFEGGVLKLSRKEIFSVNGPPGGSYSRGGRSRGRGRGSGGRR